ncbi:heavy metal translocating P-type ATPase [Sneathiella litorea]|uniref:Cadmium-translocating P-type ATPase n=1 Tax=Sneathiella litorea TaxID=2606216 RepID=A0A6L8WCS6_9PROT|nr:heavy metal translocating P-type ATPase [Sneathiella litorea]MZR32499.1 cadmium-translocating P-type ATPase [Sneathiella litorea]
MGEIAQKNFDNLTLRQSRDLGGDCCAAGAMAMSEVASPAADYDDFVSADPTAFVEADQDGNAILHTLVENMHCANCIKTVEQTLKSNPAVLDARVNFSTRRLFLRWRPEGIDVTDLVKPVIDQGYPLTPYNPAMIKSAAAEENMRLLRALAVAGFAAANVMLLSVSVWAGLFSEDMGPATRDFLHWISAMVALPAVAYAGQPFFKSALAAVRAGRLNMDVPISLAVILAAGMSLAETIQSGEHVYFDAAVTLLFFLLIGRYLDNAARSKARSAAERLLLLKAVAATIILPDGNSKTVPVETVTPGTRVKIMAGDRLPVDGVVSSGRSELDVSLITGESLPITVKTGDNVFAGTLNLNAPFEIEATKTGDNTLLGDIVRLMEAAEQGRAKYVRLADRVAEFYAPAVHLLAAATFIGWWILAGSWQNALMQAVAVLIITCPCALGLAVPVVQVVASGRLLMKGILVKAADGLERLAEVDVVVFDKTGTLTEGRLDLINREELLPEQLRLAARVASNSRHPLARAVARAGYGLGDHLEVEECPGEGLRAALDGEEVRLGSRAFCHVQEGVADDQAPGPELWLRVANKEAVQFRFRDRLRPGARTAIDRLKAQGFKVELLSGDREVVVKELAEALGIENWHAEKKPEDKVARLKTLADQGHKVLMVGDGLNDAPALSSAHASLSPASAADISQTTADFVFQGKDLSAVTETIRVARAARRLIFQNFSLAFLYNAIAVPLAVAGIVTPLIAAIAMSASSLVVCLNSLRLRLEGRVAMR